MSFRPLLLSWVLLLGSVSGCSWLNLDFLKGDPVGDPPAELVDFYQEVSFEPLWQVEVGAGSGDDYLKLAIAVGSTQVFAADIEGMLFAYNIDSGERQWSVESGEPITSGPSIDDGKIFVGTANAEILAFEQKDGTLAWRASVSSEVLATPEAAAGVLVVQAHDGNFFGFDVNSGEQLWVQNDDIPVLTMRGGSRPLISGGLAISGSASGKLLAVVYDQGRLVWERRISSPRGSNELDKMVDIDANMVVVGKLVYVASFQGHVAAINVENGRMIWRQPVSVHSGLAADVKGVFLVDDVSIVHGYNRTNGDLIWTQDMLVRRRLTGPAVIGDYIVLADFEGYLHALAKKDGRLLGRTQISKHRVLSTPVVAGNRIYILDTSGQLSVFLLN